MQVGLFYVTMINLMYASIKLGEIAKAIESFNLAKSMINSYFPSSNKIDIHYQLELKQQHVDTYVIC